MNPTPGRSLFYQAESEEGKRVVNQLLGKILKWIYKADHGCLLQFEGVADYLMVAATKLPVFGDPRPSQAMPGMMEVPVTGLQDAMAVSVSGAGQQLDSRFWRVWQDDNARLLTGMVLTGYSPSRSKGEDGTEYPSVMLEFSVDYFLVVMPIGVIVMKKEKPTRPS